MNCTLGKIRQSKGLAGQVSYSVYVTYEGEPTRLVSFVGNFLGGPVVMITGDNYQTFVAAPERFGYFAEEWVSRFFGKGNRITAAL